MELYQIFKKGGGGKRYKKTYSMKIQRKTSPILGKYGHSGVGDL
jgi:hypothetical protein